MALLVTCVSGLEKGQGYKLRSYCLGNNGRSGICCLLFYFAELLQIDRSHENKTKAVIERCWNIYIYMYKYAHTCVALFIYCHACVFVISACMRLTAVFIHVDTYIYRHILSKHNVACVHVQRRPLAYTRLRLEDGHLNTSAKHKHLQIE